MSETTSRKRCRSTEAVPEDTLEERAVPKGFHCPLTMDIMFEPVLDAEGNTYERAALLDWVKVHRISPMSRQPLSERMLIPNIALRDAIHEFMGPAWVAQKEQSQVKRARTQPTKTAMREKIDCFLQFAAKDLGGLSLTLNERGCCAFRFDNITIVIDVPEKGETFCLYTRNLMMDPNESTKDLLLEMNSSQGDTRGGCLSVKKHRNGKSEVIFSYKDRVGEISARDFLNIILNFLETSATLRRKLLQKSGMALPLARVTSSAPSPALDRSGSSAVVNSAVTSIPANAEKEDYRPSSVPSATAE